MLLSLRYQALDTGQVGGDDERDLRKLLHQLEEAICSASQHGLCE